MPLSAHSGLHNGTIAGATSSGVGSVSGSTPDTPIRLTLREKANPFKGRAKRKH